MFLLLSPSHFLPLSKMSLSFDPPSLPSSVPGSSVPSPGEEGNNLAKQTIILQTGERERLGNEENPRICSLDVSQNEIPFLSFSGSLYLRFGLASSSNPERISNIIARRRRRRREIQGPGERKRKKEEEKEEKGKHLIRWREKRSKIQEVIQFNLTI